MKFCVAVASTDGKVVNQHFGKAQFFYILQVEPPDSFICTEKRAVPGVCQGGEHQDGRLEEEIALLSDCRYVLVSRIGYRAAAELERHGVTALEFGGVISDAVDKLMKYAQIQDGVYQTIQGEEN